MDLLFKNRSILVGVLSAFIGTVVGSYLLYPVHDRVGYWPAVVAGLTGVLGVYLAANGMTDTLTRVTSAMRKALDGERPAVPADLPSYAAVLYEELDRVAGRLSRARSVEESVPRLAEAVRRASIGERPLFLG